MYTIDELHRDIEAFFKPASVRIPCRKCMGSRLVDAVNENGDVHQKWCEACNRTGRVEGAV